MTERQSTSDSIRVKGKAGFRQIVHISNGAFRVHHVALVFKKQVQSSFDVLVMISKVLEVVVREVLRTMFSI